MLIEPLGSMFNFKTVKIYRSIVTEVLNRNVLMCFNFFKDKL